MELRYKLVTFSQSSCSDVRDQTAAPPVVFPSCQLAHRFGCDVARISIYMYISPLPSLDICHDHWTLAGQTTWQHLFTCLPATIYCPSVGKHLWASSLGTTYHFFKLAFGVVNKLMLNVQLLCNSRIGRSSVNKEDGLLRNMKYVQRSTENISNVT